MGTLGIIGGMSIKMNAKDVGRHNRPHVHAWYAGVEVPVDFDGAALGGRLPPRQFRELREWLAANRRKLDAAWELAVAGERFEWLFRDELEVREAGVMYVVETKTSEAVENAEDMGESAPSTVVALRILPDYRIWARFYSGEEKVYDFKRLLGQKSLAPLRDEAFFDRGYLDSGTVCWDTGLGFWDDGIIDFDSCDIYADGVPTPESALTPEERACPVMDRNRGEDKHIELYELFKFFEDRLSEEEYSAFCKKYSKNWDPREMLRAEKARFLRAKVA